MSVSVFDFIEIREFRESLERDYAEMQSCAEAHAWKSVQVLAGSIVESLLIDYLASTTHPNRPQKDPLRVDFAEAIALSRAERAISERTADLCSVIRSYRNLIHPGRVIRLAEPQPSGKSAQIAVALVDLIVDDIVHARQASLGLTAEQVVSKIMRDENSLVILQHLVNDASERQRERLLLEVIPNMFLSIRRDEANYELDELQQLARLLKAYRVVFDIVPEAIRRKATAEFIRILREEDGDRVNAWRNAFFRPVDLKYVVSNHTAMVRQHLLNLVPPTHNADTLKFVDGIAEYLEPSEVHLWLDPFIRTLISTGVSDPVKETVSSHLLNTAVYTSDDSDQQIDKRLDDWIGYLEKNSEEQAARIRNLKEEIELSRQIPF